MKKNDNTNYFFIETSLREKAQHGLASFPCVSYLDNYCNSFYPWHWHDEVEFAYVEKGVIQVSVNNQTLELKKGEGILINSGVLHSYSETDNIVSVLPNILFNPLLLSGTKKSIYWQKYVKPLLDAPDFSYYLLKREVSWEKHIIFLLSKSFQLLQNQQFGYEILVRNYFSEILLTLHENLSINSNQVIEQKDNYQINRLRKMVHFIQNNYIDKIEVKDIADSASISVRECLRCFKIVVGISPKQYVIDLRLRRAKELLLNTSLSLIEISEECGFQDQSYFTKKFREKVGYSPGKWRKHAFENSNKQV